MRPPMPSAVAEGDHRVEAARPFDERVGGTGQADRDRHRARDVGSTGPWVARLGHVPDRGPHRHRREGDVDEEDQPPRHRVDQVAAEEGPDGTGDPGEPGPGADGPAAVIGMEGRRDDGEAPRDQERRSPALHDAGGDERTRGGGQPAHHRGRRKRHESPEEDLLPSDEVTEAAAEQQQRREADEVPVEDPLEAARAGAEVVVYRRQRHVDDRAVEERDARSEHGGEQHPSGGRGPETDRGTEGERSLATARP